VKRYRMTTAGEEVVEAVSGEEAAYRAFHSWARQSLALGGDPGVVVRIWESSGTGWEMHERLTVGDLA